MGDEVGLLSGGRGASELVLVFRCGGHLLGIEALAVRTALLRSDDTITSVGQGAVVSFQGSEYRVGSLAARLEIPAADWGAVLLVDCGTKGHHAFSVGRCELVRSVRMLATLPRGCLRDARSPLVGLFELETAAGVELGLFVDPKRLVQAVS